MTTIYLLTALMGIPSATTIDNMELKGIPANKSEVAMVSYHRHSKREREALRNLMCTGRWSCR